MTVYVDNAQIPASVGGRAYARWSHLTADTKDELHAFAERLGLRRSWFQTCKQSVSCQPNCPHWHYDVTAPKREQAIAAGAKPIGLHEMGDIIRKRRGQA